jgi:hypothetical protein
MSSTLPQFWREAIRRLTASLPGSGGTNLAFMVPMHLVGVGARARARVSIRVRARARVRVRARV